MLVVPETDAILPPAEKKMNELQGKGKEKKKVSDVKVAKMANSLRSLARHVEDAKGKDEDEMLTKFTDTLENIVKDTCDVIQTADRAQEYFVQGRNVADEVIKRRSNMKRFKNIRRKETRPNLYSCSQCDFTDADLQLVRKHMVYHRDIGIKPMPKQGQHHQLSQVI